MDSPFKHLIHCSAIILLLLLSACSQPETKPSPIAKTETGPVQGFIEGDDSVKQYLGIPYAAPPVGDLRWEKPRKPQRWKEPLDVTAIPPHCQQSMFGYDRGQEDCLYLNVWTPNLYPQKPLPVMVWVHGGGYTVGHSYETTPGAKLAKEANAVVVSMNYRLGALGFMAHPGLSEKQGNVSGNYGLLDQIHALKWIQRNIKFFGGDRSNITIMGESAGGMSVCNLLASPYSRGRFHKAIIQSGPCYSPYPDLAFMEQQGQIMAEKLGCNNDENPVACMRAKPERDILAAMPPDPGLVFGNNPEFWMPNIDGKVLKEQVFESFEKGDFAKVPVINGNNADEGSLLVMFGHEYRLRTLDAEDYPARINYLVRDNEKVKQVMEKYPLTNYPDPGAALSAVFGDSAFVCHEKFTTEALAKHTPVWSYYFSYPDADFILPEARELGAFHSAEVQFLFNEPMGWFEKSFSGKEKILSDNIIGYWAGFVHNSNPNLPAARHSEFKAPLEWHAINADGQRLQMDLELALKAGSDTDEVCDFWRGINNRSFTQ